LQETSSVMAREDKIRFYCHAKNWSLPITCRKFRLTNL